MSVTSIRLQPEVESGLEAMSGKLHRSKNWLINQAIREFVARQELEQTRWTETLAATATWFPAKLSTLGLSLGEPQKSNPHRRSVSETDLLAGSSR